MEKHKIINQVPSQASVARHYKISTVLSCTVMTAGLALHILGMATVPWTYQTVSVASLSVTIEYGLFQVCVNQTCVSWSDFPSSTDLKDISAIKASEAMAIIGAILAGLSLLFALYNTYTSLSGQAHSKEIGNCVANVGGFGGTCAFITIIIWATIIRDSEDTLGQSFIFSIVGCFVISIGACLDYNRT